MSEEMEREEFSALVDMLTLQLALGVISDLKLPDLRERLKDSANELLNKQPQEMQDDPSNKQLLDEIVDRIIGMKDTKF